MVPKTMYIKYIERKPTNSNIMTYNPNFITKLVTTLAILPIFAAPAPANAGDWDYCTNVSGGRVCAEYGRGADLVSANIPGYGQEDLVIVCANNRYEVDSYGHWNRSDVREFASSYCESRGGYAHN